MTNKGRFPILGFELNNSNAEHLDLSKFKLEELGIDAHDNSQLSDYIFNGKIRYGGYGEHRDIYSRSPEFGHIQTEQRNIHMGLDIWHLAGTSLYSPWDGIVRSAYNNDSFADYGPTLIIEHTIDDKQCHVLYGHLSTGSLSMWSEGDEIRTGELFAHLGNEQENGNWPPHVHIQLIKDLEGNRHDYPGVCSSKEWGKFSKNCPDPSPYFIQSKDRKG